MFISKWKDNLDLILGLIAIAGYIVIVIRYIRGKILHKQRRHFFLGRKSDEYIAIGSSPEGTTVRTADAEALAEFRETIGDKRIPKTCNVRKNINHIQLKIHPLMLFGSLRYNSLADELQARLDLPFQFVSMTPELPPEKSIYCIYENLGQTYLCSADPIIGELGQGIPPSCTGVETDYGLLLVGEINDEESSSQRIFWVGGIHGIGTLGTIKWINENINAYDWKKLGNVCFLIRSSFSVPLGQSLGDIREQEHIDNVRPELVRGPSKWQPRQTKKTPISILCDMGGVLLDFERKQFERNLKNLLDIQVLRSQTDAIEKLRIDFESGDESTGDFLADVKRILELSDQDEDLKKAWSSIFWRKEKEILFLDRLSKHCGIQLILVTNTDPLRLDYVFRELGLGNLFDRNDVVASFEENVRPKGEDNSMLMKAVNNLKYQNTEVVYIDDVRLNLIKAQQGGLGLKTIHYQSFPQMVYELRKFGLYLPSSEIR